MALLPPPLDHPSAGDILRWGNVLLWTGLGASLLLTFALAWRTPAYVPFLPIAIAGVIGGCLLFQRPALNLTVLLASFALVLSNDEGIQVEEVLYGLYYYAFLLYWYGKRLLEREPFVRSRTDWAIVLFGGGGLLAGIGLGFLFGGSASLIRWEATAFAMVWLYFPIKEFCRQERYGPEIILGVLLWLGVFVAVRNLLNFREIILAATEVWQVSDARPGLNDMQLLIPGLATLVLLLYERDWLRRLLLLGGFLLFTSGLVLAKSRGFWIDFAFGVFLLVVLLRGRHRWRLILLIVVGSGTMLALVFTFFGPLADLVIAGTLKRFDTLGSAFTQDRSLINRFIESGAVWDGIKKNPFLGYGFGTTFSYFDINFLTTRTKAFIHNGYLALWFKLGLGGLLVLLFSWASAVWHSLKVYRAEAVPTSHRVLALIGAVTLLSLVPSFSTSNPFMLMDQVLMFAVLLAFAGGLYQRYHAESTDAASSPSARLPGGMGNV